MQKRFLLFLVLGCVLAACSSFSAVPTPEPTVVPIQTVQVIATPNPEPTEIPTPVFSSNPYNDGMLARRNGNYARAIAAFQLVLNSKPANDLAQETQYRLGEAYWLNNDDTRALQTLNAYLQANPNGVHAPEAHYILADAYRATKDYPNALEQLKIYRAQSTTLIGDTDAVMADILVLAGALTDALAQYDRSLQDNTLSASARISILQRAADVYNALGQPAQAAARYDAANALAGDARTKANLLQLAGDAYAAANKLETALQRWNDAINKYPEQPGAYQSLVDLLNRGGTVDDYIRGVVDYYASQYDAALAAFEREFKSDSTRAGEIRYFTGNAHARKGEYTQAIADFDYILKSLPKDKRVPDAYFGKASAYAALNRLDDAVATYKKFVAAMPDNDRADDALWNAALLYDRAQRYADAATLYEELQKKYPTRDRADDALFWAGLDYYRRNDFKTAAARWQSIAENYPRTNFYSRALFWLGKAAQARRQTADAKNYWTQVSKLGNDYYAYRAKELLAPTPASNLYDLSKYAMFSDADKREFEQWLASWSKSDTPVTPTIDTATRGDLNFKRGVELLRVDRTVDARREFATLIEEKKNDPRALYALALYLHDNNLFSLALDCGEKIARLANEAGAPPAPRLLWQLRYPAAYADLVVNEAQTNNLDPLLFFALMRQESSFNPWATSSVDARGLGQVMPATGREIAQKLGVKNFSIDQLYLPYVSVRFGVWYLAQALKTWDEPVYALAAYNAGSGRVKQWQRADLDVAVEEIHLSETASYVRIVVSNWKQYQQIYR
jgi:soluble lytic murein transglycosylase